MARLAETQETFDALNPKAFSNAIKMGTYKEKSSFGKDKPIKTISITYIQKPVRH